MSVLDAERKKVNKKVLNYISICGASICPLKQLRRHLRAINNFFLLLIYFFFKFNCARE